MAVALEPLLVMAVALEPFPTQTGLDSVTATAQDFVMAMASAMLSPAMVMAVMDVELEPLAVTAVELEPLEVTAVPSPTQTGPHRVLEPVAAMVATDFVMAMASEMLSPSMVMAVMDVELEPSAVTAVELEPLEVTAVLSPTQTGPHRVLEPVAAMAATDFVMAMASEMLSPSMASLPPPSPTELPLPPPLS